MEAGIILSALVAGAGLHAVGRPAAGDAVWASGAAVLLLPLAVSVARTLLRRDIGVDAIALLAIATALALGEQLAAAVVTLMLAGGGALEAYAGGRARRELRALVERAPRTANRRLGDVLETIGVEGVEVGDLLVVRAGEVVPVDGVVVGAVAALDESALSGEPLPVERLAGDEARSGSVNAGNVFELRALRRAEDSAYSAVVRLVREAEAHRAPFVRLADRYAAVFFAVTVATAAVAWAVAGDPVRALAVLVVATPCPLILAAPIALVAGISRAARAGVVVKSGAAIEKLGEARTVLLDKTGTLTAGRPDVTRVVPFDGLGENEALRLAASLDQLSVHSLAHALVREAGRRGLDLGVADDVREVPGSGIRGTVGARRVVVGSEELLAREGYPVEDALRRLDGAGDPATARVLIGVDGKLVAGVVLADRLRPNAASMVRRLRDSGISHVALVTGDRAETAAAVGDLVGVDRVYAEQSPGQKLDVVRLVQARPELRPVVMVGDGINDAPALALADVGVAIGGAGATVAAETADAVLLDDDIGRVARAVEIGRGSMRIARQSVLAGIALSLVAMGFAAAGAIPPLFGALLQEAIDVAVIVNALRALRA